VRVFMTNAEGNAGRSGPYNGLNQLKGRITLSGPRSGNSGMW
jgi:hypothetical protein